MPHGDYGSTARPSWELLGEALGRLVEYRTGWQAQLRYLDRTRGGAPLLASEGLTPTSRQRARWTSGGKPTKANQAAIDRAYRTLRTRNVVRVLSRKLEAGGGTRIEIHPEDQTGVEAKGQRPDLLTAGPRNINVRRWFPLVAAWARGETGTGPADWHHILQDLGSDWRAYLYASSVGILI